jgi:chorismate mutase
VSDAWDGITNVTISPERLAKDRKEALERVRLEINALDTEIADLLLQRLAKGRYARYLHPDYIEDYTRELQVMARYTKKLCPYASKEAVADLCMVLFRMSRPPSHEAELARQAALQT